MDLIKVSEQQEQIIQAYVRAEERFWKMVKKIEDNAALRLSVLTRQVEVRHQRQGLRNKQGIPDSGGPADLSISLSAAVKLELKAMEPRIRHLVAWRREQRRLAVGCGPVQITVSRAIEARRNFRELYRRSMCSIREIAQALGISSASLGRLLTGKDVARARMVWARNVESISRDGDFIIIAVRVGRTKKKWGWQMSADQHDDLVNGRRTLQDINDEILEPERDEIRYAREVARRSSGQRLLGALRGALSSKSAFIGAWPAPGEEHGEASTDAPLEDAPLEDNEENRRISALLSGPAVTPRGHWGDGARMVSSGTIVDDARPASDGKKP